eukprot:TRINITY_DN34992_c0_g1_i1.p1 TRINITY_DN34992_c0_g1~~TRINITY_DN34992_c0_g1_i1.p1  ORF type:complete len:960 (+),score=218.02 TRINITY_DN34992_c0_g1_i1:166-3045(+)
MRPGAPVSPPPLSSSHARSACRAAGSGSTWPSAGSVGDAAAVLRSSAALAKARQWSQAVKALDDSFISDDVAGDVQRLQACSSGQVERTCCAVVGACTKKGQWFLAVDLFHKLWARTMQPDDFVFSAAANALEKGSEWQGVGCLLDAARAGGVSPSAYSMASALSSCREVWGRALTLVWAMDRWNVEASVVTYNAALTSFAEGAQWSLAVLLLGELRSAQLEATVVSCSTAISACRASGEVPAARQLWNSMHDSRIEANDITCTAMLGVCAAAAAWQDALHFLWEFQQLGGRPSCISYSRGIDAMADSRQWEWAVRLFDDMESSLVRPDPMAFCSLLSALGAAVQWEKAASLLAKMREQRCSPDVTAYSIVASACAAAQQWMQAGHLLWQLQEEQLAADVVMYGALLTACEKGRQWERAFQLLRQMKAETVEVNVVACNAAMSACEKSRRLAAGLKLFSWMRGSHMQPDVVTCSALVSAADKDHNWGLALDLFFRTASYGQEASIVSMSAAVSACGKAQQWVHSLELLRGATSWQLTPNVHTYGAAMSSCEKAEEWETALLLLEEMAERSLEATLATCNAALSACEKGSQVHGAAALLQHMRQSQLTPDIISYNAAVTACSRSGNWQMAAWFLEEMAADLVEADVVTLENAWNAIVFSDALSADDSFDMACALASGVVTKLTLWLRLLLLGDKARITAQREQWYTSRENPAGSAVQAVECLQSEDAVEAATMAAFRRLVHAPSAGRLNSLRAGHSNDAEGGQLTDGVLERQFSLGADGTAAVLTLCKDTAVPQRPWDVEACFALRAALLDANFEPSFEPSTAFIAAQLRFAASDAVAASSRGRLFGCGIPDDAAALTAAQARLRPVFVDHDRSMHAERQALLSLIEAHSQGWLPDALIVRLFVSHTLCISCLAVCCQFAKALPHARLNVAFSTWREGCRWAGFGSSADANVPHRPGSLP